MCFLWEPTLKIEIQQQTTFAHYFYFDVRTIEIGSADEVG